MAIRKVRKAAPAAQAEMRAADGAWPERLARGLVLFFAATLPLYYDLAVPEVSGDPRWMATSFFAGAGVLALLAGAYTRGGGQVRLRWPLVFWFAAGLALWAAVSLVDALNWMRGIILLKALYAQLTLMAVVFWVATPKFLRQLMWALVAPLAFTSFLGFAHFKGWNAANFGEILSQSWFFWLQPLFWVLGQTLHFAASHLMDAWPPTTDFVGQITMYFQQSAIPGSTFANKNLAGSWTAMMLPVAFYLLITAKRWPTQGAASVLLAMGSLFLVYSRARASWVALFAALLTLGVVVLATPAWRAAVWRHLDRRHVLWLMVPLLTVAVWGRDVSPIKGYHGVDRTVSEQMEALGQSSWNEIGGRVAYNLNSLVITRDYWFNGVGLGSFMVVYPYYYNAIVATPTNSYSVNARPQRTHTDVMQAFDEMGIPGGILYVGVFVLGIGMAFRLGGARAGGLGSKLVGAGVTFAVLGLMAFLEWQGMLALPRVWGGLVQMALAAGVIGLLVWAWRDARALQREAGAAGDTQLLGLMAGISVLTISINALMDFPMQLPTAPAAAMLLIGAIAAIYAHDRPQARYGGGRVWAAGRPAAAAAFVLVLAVTVLFLYDAWKFREGNVLLKQAMIRVASGLNDEATVAVLDAAYAAYPLDPRIHENIGVVYANYNGATPIGLEDRIAKLEWVLTGDRWGPSHIVNLCGQYLQLAEAKVTQGDMPAAAKALGRVEELYGILQRVADFSHYTWGVGGMLRLMQGRNEDAISLFRRALNINPDYAPALAGMRLAEERARVKPITVRDASVTR